MYPKKAIKEKEKENKKNNLALEYIISEINNDPDATAREKKLADAIIALRDYK